MVDYAILNSLSLPFESRGVFIEKLNEFLDLLKELKNKNKISTVVTFFEIKNSNIIVNMNFHEFLRNETDMDVKYRVTSLLVDNIFVYTSSAELELDLSNGEECSLDYGLKEYKYNGISSPDMGYVDMFNTVLVSFNSNNTWDTDKLKLEKTTITSEGDIETTEVDIYHASNQSHVKTDSKFFENRYSDICSALFNNLEKNAKKYLSKIIICPSVIDNFDRLDYIVKKNSISILYSLEIKNNFTDYQCSSESQTVKNSPKLKQLRKFRLPCGTDCYMYDHIKNLPDGYRIHFYKDPNGDIYIGYIGKHLKTAIH